MKEKLAALLQKADAIQPGTMLVIIMISVLITLIICSSFSKPTAGPFKEFDDDTLHP